jgi:hypothetical protein
MLFILGLILVVIGAGVFLGAGRLWGYTKSDEYREPRTILCPETLQPASVRVDAAYAAHTALAGRERWRLSACSRWPERRGCNQACATQVPLVGDSRVVTQYAAFGMHPRFLRVNTPVRMSSEMYARMK